MEGAECEDSTETPDLGLHRKGGEQVLVMDPVLHLFLFLYCDKHVTHSSGSEGESLASRVLAHGSNVST